MSPGNLRGATDLEVHAGRERPRGEGQISVCHIVSGDLWAGAEVQVATLLKCLSRETSLALAAIVLNSGRLADEIQSYAIETRVIPENKHGFLAIARESIRFLKGRDVQILHSHRYKENLLAALMARRLHIPCVVRTQHGLPEPQAGLRRLKQQLILSLDRFLARRSTDRVISVSSEMTQALARHLNARKIATIPNGIDLERTRSLLAVAEAKENLGIPRNCPVIGTAGRLEPVKRLDLFLEMAAVIIRERPDVRFVISGDGREAARLWARAEALGIHRQVFFLGHRNDVFDVLRAFDVLVLSSDHEGLPMVLLEAMALGVVVVARAVGGIPEVIRNGVNGVLVDSSDPAALASACRQFLDSPARSKQVAEAARDLVANDFSAERAAGQVRQLYYSLLGLR